MNVDMTTALPATATGAATAASAKSKATVDYNSFLRLLIAQMKNQDPTQPMDSTQYVSQLATFSQVEQTVQTNAKLDQILQASALAQADSLIGHLLTSADGATSGVVKEARLGAGGLIAVLDDGAEIAVGPGVRVTNAG
jgi:flagellar basal-body rod modification protein FlgD